MTNPNILELTITIDNVPQTVILTTNDIITAKLLAIICTVHKINTTQNQFNLVSYLSTRLYDLSNNCYFMSTINDFVSMIANYTNTLSIDLLIADIDANF